MFKNNNILFIAMFHVFLSNLIRNRFLLFLFGLLFNYWYTNNIFQSLLYGMIPLILSMIFKTTKEHFDKHTKIANETTDISTVTIKAETPQTVMYSENDDPDKPDNIELNPFIPIVDLTKTQDWAKERQFRQATQILKEESQLGANKTTPNETAALEPESFSSLFYY